MRKFSGSGPCCSCETPLCPMSCDCYIGGWFPYVNGPEQFLVSNLVVPSSYRFWSAEYVFPCPDIGCPTEFDPAEPSVTGPLISITPHHKIGYKTLGSFVLENQHDSETGFCGWAADISGFPLASSKEDLWGFDVLGVGTSAGTSGENEPCIFGNSMDSAWTAQRPTVTMEPGNLNLGVDWGENASGMFFSGLRRIELIDGVSCFRPHMVLYPEQVWTPLTSRHWESQLGYCPNPDNPATEGGFSGPGVPPLSERYWDIDSFQIDNWDSPNLSGPPSFAIWFENAGPQVTRPYQFLGVDLECNIDRYVSKQMSEGSVFDDNSGVAGSAGNCGDPNYEEYFSDATIHTYSGTEKCLATLDTNKGQLCDCWSNPNSGGGCLLFPSFGPQPDGDLLVENLVWDDGSTVATQNGLSEWDNNNVIWRIKVPTDVGDAFFEPHIGISNVGRTIHLEINGTNNNYDLDSCNGTVIGVVPSTSITFTADFPHGQDCDDCNEPSSDYGCCINSDGTVTTTTEGICTSGGGTYLGNDSTCPPVGCCQISGSSDLSGVTEAHCTTQGGIWTEGATCVTGWCTNDTTGAVTAGIEEDECTGTWSATEPTIGCCDILGTEHPDVAQGWCSTQLGTFTAGDCPEDPTGCCIVSGGSNVPNQTEAECDALGGVWDEGEACGPLGWCVDDTTGVITANVEEDECVGTWTSTEPTSGCCTISGTQNPDVAQSWCTAQSGTFVAGACPAPTIDWRTQSGRVKINSLTMDLDDPNFDCSDPIYYYNPSLPQYGAYTTESGGARNTTVVDGEFWGVTTSDPSPALSDILGVDFTNENTADITWSLQFASGIITFTASGVTFGSGCSPTATGSLTVAGGIWSASCGGQSWGLTDLVASFSITMECEP